MHYSYICPIPDILGQKKPLIIPHCCILLLERLWNTFPMICSSTKYLVVSCLLPFFSKKKLALIDFFAKSFHWLWRYTFFRIPQWCDWRISFYLHSCVVIITCEHTSGNNPGWFFCRVLDRLSDMASCFGAPR